ncbi:Sugar transport protein 14 [Acorus calamus]|uniref:Sugar transport protein 14 n=1 Tax=Acorus calamus TaxID=4465 RepID=A0AAV9CB58_ACOCL|nr:Sugar transport protein 14 [Acorus calamus]
MAGGFGSSERGKRAELYEGRVTVYFVIACLVAALGGSLFGYDLGVSGGVTSMDDFLKDFFPKVYRRKQAHLHETDYCKYDNQILTLFTSSLYFAGLTSTFTASHVTRNRGRRASILIGAISFFCGAVLNAAAVNIGMLIIGRILLGIGIGFGNQVRSYNCCLGGAAVSLRDGARQRPGGDKPALPADNLPRHPRRGPHQLLHGAAPPLGVAPLPRPRHGPRHPHVRRRALPPGDPNSLVEQGRLEEARAVLERVRGTKRVDAEFADLVEASEAARAVKRPFRNLFARKNRPQLVIGAVGIPMFQQLSGMNSILFYAPVIFQSLGFGSGAALYSSIITGSMLVVGALVSMALVDRLGRRFLFLEAGFQMITSLIVIATILALKFGTGVLLPKADASVLVIFICLFVVAYGWSWGPLGWLVPSEIFPLETRSAGQSMVVCVNLFFTAAMAQCFLASLCHLRYGVFILFAGLIVVMSVFIALLLPETKKVPIEEMHFLWERHWFWKSFVGSEEEGGGRGENSGEIKPVREV